MKYFIYLITSILLMCTTACNAPQESSQGEGFLSQVDGNKAQIVDDSELLTFFDKDKKPLQPAFQAMPTGSNLPTGWLLEMMENDLAEGMVGALDELYPGIKSDDLYHNARRGGMEDIPEMGDLVLTGAAWEKSIMWWNAETIGNWWDGFVRHAFLTKNQDAMDQSKAIVDNLLASQDEDGYIGIYKENLRYQHDGSNGELWAQTTAFRMLLAYYEMTQEAKVLEAVERAMAVTMKNYNQDARNPFYLQNAFGGVTHGLMMTDVCETLFRITDKEVYQDYATFLYRAFSTYSINRSFNDLRYPYLVDKDSAFEGHGVHTYEHFRSLLQAYYATGHPELKTAWENALEKLEPCLLPSGAGHGNEWIAKLKAHPEHTATEYCTMLELRNFYGSAIQKTGDIQFADAAEKLTFNGMMGARNQEGTALSYSKADNCYLLDGKHHEEGKTHDDPRYKYSPTHSEPAVCCVPNYTRNYTYYLDQMWMKSAEGIVATLYGPSTLTTEWKGKSVSIEQITNYPFSDEIELRITAPEPVEFTLSLRKPGWAKSMELNEEADLNNGFYQIKKTWKSGDVVRIQFENEVQTQTFQNGEIYVQRGPLVYALEIPHETKTVKSYGKAGFTDYYCLPKDSTARNMAFSKAQLATMEFHQEGLSKDNNPWYQGTPYIQGDFIDPKSNKNSTQKLIPMGNTVLRRVTFPVQ